jgi:hypothetical protein
MTEQKKHKFDCLTPKQELLLQHYAHKADARPLPILYIDGSMGGWTMGKKGEQIAVTGSAWTVLVDLMDFVWSRHEKDEKGQDRVVERIPVRVLEKHDPPRPNTHPDKNLWDTFPSGEKKDPWRPSYEVPMQSQKTGKLACYKAEKSFHREPIAIALAAFSEKRRRPIVRLCYVATGERRNGQSLMKPTFEVIGFDEGAANLTELLALADNNNGREDYADNIEREDHDDNVERDASGIKHDPNITTGPIGNGRAKNSDMDDDIPF